MLLHLFLWSSSKRFILSGQLTINKLYHFYFIESRRSVSIPGDLHAFLLIVQWHNKIFFRKPLEKGLKGQRHSGNTGNSKQLTESFTTGGVVAPKVDQGC